MRIGIMGAMNEEVAPLISDVKNRTQEDIGVRTYHSGLLYDKDVVVTASGWGKTASASAATTLLVHCGAEIIILFGVAGAASGELNIGDVIVAKDLIHHDLDPSPIFPKYQVPLLGMSRFETDTRLRNYAISAVKKFISSGIIEHSIDNPARFHITKPAIYQGLIASGDQFISSTDVLSQLRNVFPDIKCVEMEGASVAQVCYEHKIPLAVVKVISDKADKSAKTDFPLFLSKVISHYSRGIIQNFLDQL